MITPTEYLFSGHPVGEARADHGHAPVPSKAGGQLHGSGHGAADGHHAAHTNGRAGHPYHLCAHGHKEMNYRKKALGWKAYYQCDSFAPFQVMLPRYHVETVYPGRWFGAGHYNMKEKWWTFGIQGFATIGGGLGIGYFQYWVRMHRNGWVIKNKGAITGID